MASPLLARPAALEALCVRLLPAPGTEEPPTAAARPTKVAPSASVAGMPVLVQVEVLLDGLGVFQQSLLVGHGVGHEFVGAEKNGLMKFV